MLCGRPTLFIFVTTSAALCLIIGLHVHSQIWNRVLRHGRWQRRSVKGAWRRLRLLWDGMYEKWVRLEREGWVVRVKALKGCRVRICIL